MHHLEGPLLGLEALFSLPFLSSCTYLSVKCLWLLHCRNSAAERQWELSSARGPRNTLRIQQGGQEIATPHCPSFPFGRPDQANVPYLCQQRAGDLRFCHSRRWFGMQAGQTPPQQLPLCSRDRAGRSAAPAGIPKGSQTTTYGSWSFHFSCKLLPAGKTVFLKMGRCTMHSPASSPPPPHPRNKKGSTEFAGSDLLLDIKRVLRTCSCIHILKIEKWKSCPPLSPQQLSCRFPLRKQIRKIHPIVTSTTI